MAGVSVEQGKRNGGASGMKQGIHIKWSRFITKLVTFLSIPLVPIGHVGPDLLTAGSRSFSPLPISSGRQRRGTFP